MLFRFFVKGNRVLLCLSVSLYFRPVSCIFSLVLHFFAASASGCEQQDSHRRPFFRIRGVCSFLRTFGIFAFSVVFEGKKQNQCKKALDKSFPSRYTCCQQQGRCEMNFIRSRSCPFLRKCEKNAFYEERDGKQSRFPPPLECFQERNDFGGGIPDGQHRRAFRQQRFQ